MNEPPPPNDTQVWRLRPTMIAFNAEEFYVPTSGFHERDEMIHAEVQKMIALIYAMIACGCDLETINQRLLAL